MEWKKYFNLNTLKNNLIKGFKMEFCCPTNKGLSFKSDYSYSYKNFNDKISTWRSLETAFQNHENQTTFTKINLSDLHNVRNEVLNAVKYVPDEIDKDIFSPSAVTLSRGYGDCEDQAIAIMSSLFQLGYSIDQVFCLTFSYHEKVNGKFQPHSHTVCCIIDNTHDMTDNCYVIDNGLFDTIEKGNVYFGYMFKQVKIENVFNIKGSIQVEFIPFS